MSADKLCARHLARKAVLYVRQSSAHQVLRNREGIVKLSGCGRHGTRDAGLAH